MKKKVVIIGFLITAVAFSCKQSGNKETKLIVATTPQTEDTTIIIANQFFKPLLYRYSKIWSFVNKYVFRDFIERFTFVQLSYNHRTPL